MTGHDIPASDGSTPESSFAGGQMQIGIVADRLGLSVRTLHHWEEMGLVTPSARSAGGFRLYTESDVTRLTIIRRMKPLGFSLDEMRELLDAFQVFHSPEAGQCDKAKADEVIEQCRRRVDESRNDLRRRLAWADEFENLLVTRSVPGATDYPPAQ